MKPSATYRLQFNREFTFAHAAGLARYFRDLGISHIYASPILTARLGSAHGYDVVDHSQINPELGGEAGFLELSSVLREHGLGLIVDIVPNHVAVGKADNPWWMDLLQNGPDSQYADYFDIDWNAPGLEGKVFAPFLGEAPLEAWRKGDLRLVHDEIRGWAFAYFEHRFPLRARDQSLDSESLSVREAMDLLRRQNFVLADWREADARINWRRFFDITDLAAIRVLEPKVFEATHGKILSLYAKGSIDGLRVDHVDGISDPAAYCRTLRRRMDALRPGGYLVVEKILASSESLPEAWETDGTTGYDFMNDVSALLHAPDGQALEQIWQQEGKRDRTYEEEECQARAEMLTTKFASQLEAVIGAFLPLLPAHRSQDVRAALIGVITLLRCYRSYATGLPDSPGPGPHLLHAFDRAKKANPDLVATLTDLGRLFEQTEADREVGDALRRFSQLSAPVAAKAVEDTAFYRYGRILSRNDVGFDPRQHRIGIKQFHERITERSRHSPATMLATSTHDHKRGADARARLAALPAFAAEWDKLVQSAPRPPSIHSGDAYQLYQTILGSWPEEEAMPDFAFRVEAWCIKYLREAKLRSFWANPNVEYEKAFRDFSNEVLLGSNWSAWRSDLKAFLGLLNPQVRRNQIAQTVLHLTVPGVPDIYQGCEFEDLSLVDPDNRRPVDYQSRIATLATGKSLKQNIIAALLRARRDHFDLWSKGDYVQVAIAGATDHVVGFSRNYGNASLFVMCQLRDIAEPRDVIVHLARGARDLLTNRHIGPGAHALPSLLDALPACVLLSEKEGGETGGTQSRQGPPG